MLEYIYCKVTNMNKKIEKSPGCVAFAAKILGDNWTILIIRNLCDGCLRFGELQQMVGVNPRTLSARLDFLEEAGIITRKMYTEIPVKVEYSLTDKGKDLIPILQKMAAWGEKYGNSDSQF